MRKRLLLIAASLWFTGAFPCPAGADPITAAVLTWVTSAAFVASTAGSIVLAALDVGLAVGLSYLQQALAGKPQPAAPQIGVSGTLQGGGVVPRSFGVGYFSTAGSLVYANTWGQSGKTPNAYLTYVIALSDLPVTSLEEVWVADSKVTYNTGGTPVAWGYPVPEYNLDGADHLWVRFYDGTQTAADSWLVSQFGADPDYPWSSANVGTGIAYVIVTALIEPTLFSGFPRYKFALHGAKFYDPRQDSTVGGSGAQRWNNQSTWAWTANPKVIEYNILRGISYAGQWFYGLQSLTAARLPTGSWFAAMNECDDTVSTHDGGSEPKYRCGGEITVDVQPADAIDAIEKSCNGRLAEIGGIYKTHVGAAGASVMAFDDDTIIVTEEQTFDQFPSLANLINSVTASYPEPAEGWAMKDAPARYDAALEAADGDRTLTSDVQYTLVPYAEQVQRLMKSALAEARRFRRHTITLPPSAWALEPLDYVLYSSARNGYTNKLFRIDAVHDKANLDVVLYLTEVDPSDYDWTASSDYTPFTTGALVIRRPGAQAIVDWSASGVILVGDNGLEKPGIELSWDPDVRDVDGVQFQIRRQSTGIVVYSGETDYWDAGSIDISQNLSANTVYEVRGKYRPHSDRDTTWSSWISVTTPDTKIQGSELNDGAISIAKFAAGITAVEIVSSLPVSGNYEGRTVVLTTDGKLYRYHSGAWTAAVPTVDLVGTITAAQIAQFAIDNTKLASGLTTVEIVSSLPATGNYEGRTVVLTTDGKLYRYHSGAWTAATAASDIAGAITGSQIAAATLTTANFAANITPVEIVSSLPASGNFEGRTVLLTTDGKVYRYHSGGFTTAVDGADIAANSITAGAIQAGAIGASQIAAGAIIASKVVIADPSNLIADPAFADPAFWTTDPQAAIVGAASTEGGALGNANVLRMSSSGAVGQANTGITFAATASYFSVEQNVNYRLAAQTWVTNGFNGLAQAFLQFYDNTYAFISQQVFNGIDYRSAASASNHIDTIGGTVTSPANAAFAKIFYRVQWPASAASAGRMAWGNCRCNRAVDNSLIVDGTINASKLVANSITAATIAAGAIGTSQLAAGAVTSAKIAANTITAADIAAGTITSNEIAANTITSGNIAANAITSSKIAANAITAGAIQAGVITATELQVGAASQRIHGQLSADKALSASDVTLWTNSVINATANGNAPFILYLTLVASSSSPSMRTVTITVDPTGSGSVLGGGGTLPMTFQIPAGVDTILTPVITDIPNNVSSMMKYKITAHADGSGVTIYGTYSTFLLDQLIR